MSTVGSSSPQIVGLYKKNRPRSHCFPEPWPTIFLRNVIGQWLTSSLDEPCTKTHMYTPPPRHLATLDRNFSCKENILCFSTCTFVCLTNCTLVSLRAANVVKSCSLHSAENGCMPAVGQCYLQLVTLSVVIVFSYLCCNNGNMPVEYLRLRER